MGDTWYGARPTEVGRCPGWRRRRWSNESGFCTIAGCRCTVTELCARYGISRKTAYKWLGRFAAGGKHHPIGLEEIADGIWSIHFYHVRLGHVDERDYIIRP